VTLAPPYVVRADVAHRRTRPFDYSFRHRTTSWLVDAHDPEAGIPPRLRWLASIRAGDHLGSEGTSLPAKLRVLLDEQGLSWTAHRVLLLVNARTAGYVFNPLTTWFVFAADGSLEGILAEVHNTYGERHVYPLSADAAAGGSTTDKEFYVSPFFAVEGRYDIRARLSENRVSVAITLTQDDEQVFTGSVVGHLVPATRRTALRAILRDPFASQRVTALIRWHGIRLWLRRLPVVKRTPHRAPRGMA
jgi:DUF1365 family protein